MKPITSYLSKYIAKGCFAFSFMFSLSSNTAYAQNLCVYDPGGKAGDYYRLLEGYALEASAWGVSFDIQAYTDESTAVKDYEAGQCDAVLATGARLQRFNSFPTTVEAIGALPEYSHLKYMVKTLSTSKGAASKLVRGGNETAGIVPLGAVYLLVRDRNIDTVSELAGKRIATLDYDKPSLVMVEKVGAIMVPADLGSLGPKFNNGDVDACYVSAPAYAPFELWRGLGKNGGIVKLPLAQSTLQLLIHQDKFPEGFGAQSRTYFYKNFDKALNIALKAEGAIDKNLWIELPASTLPGFDTMFQDTRVDLRDKHKAYNGQMLSVMKKHRCKTDATRAECVDSKE